MMESITILRKVILHQMMKDNWGLRHFHVSHIDFKHIPTEVYVCDSSIFICQSNSNSKWYIGIDENYFTLGELGINKIYFLILLYLFVIPSSKNQNKILRRNKINQIASSFLSRNKNLNRDVKIDNIIK